MTNENKSTICPIPWNHIAIQQNGEFRICCQNIYSPFGKLKENEVFLSINNSTIDEARNSNLIKELRSTMLKGERHDLCRLCYSEEDVGLHSKRNHMLSIYGTENINEYTDSDGSIDTNKWPVRYIDIRFGNLCNLKCRYCGPTDSSLWYEDYYKLQKSETAKISYYGSKIYEIKKENNKYIVDSLDFEWYEADNFWQQIDKLLPHIDRYYFTGGEPTINKTHFELLQQIIDKGYAKNVVLEYNSNMFAIPDKLYDQWKEFKEVGIGCSIDGINDMSNYLRPPSKWDVLEKNLDILGNNPTNTIRGSIATTVSVFNVLHFLDITKWLLQKNYKRIRRAPSYHVLEGPKPMSIQVLPIATKEFILAEYEEFYKYIGITYGAPMEADYRKMYSGITNYMMAKDNSSFLPDLKIHTQRLDDIRGDDLSLHVPWLSKILETL